MADADLILPAPLAHQLPILEHAARFKVWRAGRRTGKSRLGVIAAASGHGPHRRMKGVMQGGAIAWVGPDYKQTAAIWREEIRPRFAGLPWATVKESERRVEVPALGGSLELLSAENIDALRGRKFDGVIVDEAAHLDLEYAYTAVIRPALADRQGWALFISSPNGGLDGNSQKVIPSYFNRLVQRIEAGNLPDDWATWHNRTEDNARLPRAEVAAMRAEYPPDSPTVQQEIDALLVAGGLLAFPELVLGAPYLIPRPERLPRHWMLFGAFDWGYAHPFSFGLYAVDEQGQVYGVDHVSRRKHLPPGIVDVCRGMLAEWGVRFQDLQYTVAGSDVFSEPRARGETGPTLFEQFHAAGWTMIEANTARQQGYQHAKKHLNPLPGQPPAMRWYDTPGNRELVQVLMRLVTDPARPEDVLKVNADVNGIGGDDPYDQWRYGIMSRPWAAQPLPTFRHEDQDRGRLPGQPDPRRSPTTPNRPNPSPPWRRPTQVHEVEV